MTGTLICRLINLRDLKGKRLAHKIAKQGRPMGSDKHQAYVMLTNTVIRVRRRWDSRKQG